MADDRGDEIATFDLSVLVRYADLAVEGLGAAREEIDALNVYPVPDGDTGTNMYLTVESARDQMAERLAGSGGEPGDLRLALASYSRGALLGARGNSGVILSQLIGALIRRIGQAGPDGGLETKAQYLRRIERDTQIEKWDMTNQKVTLTGDRATLTGTVTFFFHDGRAGSADFIDKFVWRDGRWQATGSELKARAPVGTNL